MNSYIIFDCYLITLFEGLLLDEQTGGDLLGVGERERRIQSPS